MELTRTEASFLGGTSWRGANTPAPIQTHPCHSTYFLSYVGSAMLHLGLLQISVFESEGVSVAFYSLIGLFSTVEGKVPT